MKLNIGTEQVNQMLQRIVSFFQIQYSGTSFHWIDNNADRIS